MKRILIIIGFLLSLSLNAFATESMVYGPMPTAKDAPANGETFTYDSTSGMGEWESFPAVATTPTKATDNTADNALICTDGATGDGIKQCVSGVLGGSFGAEKFTVATCGAGITCGTGWTITDGVATKTAGNENTLSQDTSEVACDSTTCETYRVIYTVTKTAGTGIRVRVGGQDGLFRTASGAYTEYLMSASTEDFQFIPSSDFAGSIALNSISVKKVSNGDLTVDGKLTLRGFVDGKFPVHGSLRVQGNSGRNDAYGVYNNMGVLEVGGTCTGNDYCNSFFTSQALTSTTGGITATNGYVQTAVSAPSGTPQYSSDITNLMSGLSFMSPATYTINNAYGFYQALNESADSTGTYNITNLYGGYISSTSNGTGTFNVSEWFPTLYLGSMDALATGTTAKKAGLLIAKQTIGTNNYGTAQEGQGAGADTCYNVSGTIVSCIRQETTNKMSYDGMSLNDLGTMQICSLWAAIANPYMCLGHLNRTGAGNETDMIGGYLFALNNIASTDISVQGLTWELNGAGGNEYYSRADSGTTFSFGNGSTDSAFSIAALVEVTDTATYQYIISKNGDAGYREWYLDLWANETAVFQTYDGSAGVGCLSQSNAAIPTGTHLIIVTYAGGSGADVNDGVFFYVDGAAIAMAANSSCTDYVAMENTAQPVYVGSGDAGAFPFKGDMGNIAIFNEALTADKVLKMWNSTKAIVGL